MEKRQERDQRYLSAMEEITQQIRKSEEEHLEEGREPEFHAQRLRYQQLEDMVASERRLLEEISLPCRLVLEHLSTFLDQPDRSISIRYGQCQYSNGAYRGFSINEWGHVTLHLGNFSVTWRDDDYQYMFYADKVILRAFDIQKPEIGISFNFSLKYSKLLEDFKDITEDRQTGYCQPDLFENC